MKILIHTLTHNTYTNTTHATHNTYRFVAELPGGLITDSWISTVRALVSGDGEAMREEMRDRAIIQCTLGLNTWRVSE